MRVIVPALISDKASEALLVRTIRMIPCTFGTEVFLVTQGNRPSLPRYDHLQELHWFHSDTPLQKWGAVCKAVDSIPRDSQPVLLLDADDSVSPGSLQNIWSRCARENVSFLVGDRNKIALTASDQLSPSSRRYVELFTNTLLLLVMDEIRPERTWYPDIQSGTYVLRSDLLHAIDFSEVRAYGGELVLFYQLRKAGAHASGCPITSLAGTRSSYTLRTIIDNVLTLRCFRDVSSQMISQAKRLAPSLYARYFDGGEADQFAAEIDRILDFRSTRAPGVVDDEG